MDRTIDERRSARWPDVYLANELQRFPAAGVAEMRVANPAASIACCILSNDRDVRPNSMKQDRLLVSSVLAEGLRRCSYAVHPSTGRRRDLPPRICEAAVSAFTLTITWYLRY